MIAFITENVVWISILGGVILLAIVALIWVCFSEKKANAKYDAQLRKRKMEGKPIDRFNGLYVSEIKKLESCWYKFVWQGCYYLGWNETGTTESGTLMVQITKEQYDVDDPMKKE